ncbi:hypothetical protein D3C78_581130 [compost metagenome]
MYPNTIPPIKLGMKKIVLNTLVPFSFLVNNIASMKANTLIVRTDRTVNLTVKPSAFRNS